MDNVTGRLMEILASREYEEASGAAGRLLGKASCANRFQADAVFAEAASYFSRLREERPEIYDIISIKEKEIIEALIRVKTGKGIVLD